MATLVQVADEQSEHPVDADGLKELAERVLESKGVQAAAGAELNVLFVGEAEMAELNQRFLGHEGATDVLSFPIDDDLSLVRHGVVPAMLGDVVICPAVAHRNAADHAGTYEAELDLLLVHGILHILGMDHVEDPEAEEMEKLERELLSEFGRSPGGGGGEAGLQPSERAGR